MILKTLPFLLLIIIFTISCKTSTEISIDKSSTLLPNNEVIELEKENKDSKTFGSITNHYYGSSHRFTYKFKLKNANIKWNGGTAEPKHILFHKDSIFLSFLKDKTITTPYVDSITNETRNTYHNEVQKFYQKHIDKRYFFKLLGSDYWIDITEENYLRNIENGLECKIKNDNELILQKDSIKQ